MRWIILGNEIMYVGNLKNIIFVMAKHFCSFDHALDQKTTSVLLVLPWFFVQQQMVGMVIILQDRKST